MQKFAEYVRCFEYGLFAVWFRHHLRCFWIYSEKNYSSVDEMYEDYAKHVHLPVDTVKKVWLGKEGPLPQILEEMDCKLVERRVDHPTKFLYEKYWKYRIKRKTSYEPDIHDA